LKRGTKPNSKEISDHQGVGKKRAALKNKNGGKERDNNRTLHRAGGGARHAPGKKFFLRNLTEKINSL